MKFGSNKEETLNKIKSIVEKNMIDLHYGVPLTDEEKQNLEEQGGEVPSQQDVFTDGSDSDNTFNARRFRDLIAQCLFDILSDTDSNGSISTDSSFSGGNKSGGNKNSLYLEFSDDVEIKVGSRTFKITSNKVSVS